MKISEIRQRLSLTEQAHARLKKAIREGVLTQHRFYPLRELAEQLGVSRTPVREAAIKLAHEGLAEIVPQRGFRVRTIPPAEVTEVFELRRILEGRAVEKLAERANRSDVRALFTLLERQERAIKDIPRFLDIDEEFHMRLLELSGLPRARDFLVTLRDIICLLGLEALNVGGRTEEVLKEHTAIVEGIARSNASEARQALLLHLDSTRDKIKNTASAAEIEIANAE
ncbi:MAG: GntR family transcriptional regulator [Gammaproteobacteria bacterium]